MTTKRNMIDVSITYDGAVYSANVDVIPDDWENSKIVEFFVNGELSTDTGIHSIVIHHNYQRLSTIGNLLLWKARHEAGDDSIEQCCVTLYWADTDYLHQLYDGRYAFCSFTIYWDDEYYLEDDCSSRRLRRADGSIDDVIAPDSYWRGLYICEHCDCYIENDEDYYGNDECVYCHEEHGIIDQYGESHSRPAIYWDVSRDGALTSTMDGDDFAGLGFELEVDCNYEQSHNNADVAEGLAGASGLDDNQVRFAYDGSLDYGFEIISQPHTIRAFWSNVPHWEKMLAYLAGNHYTSHDAGTCGLHVHVSRAMFGADRNAQDRAISKIYTFFDVNWEALSIVSRRENFHYCHHNELYDHRYGDTPIETYKKWKKQIRGEGGHGVALNNCNRYTFEYRLGRGTLNPASFFAWIDLVIVLTKNAKRINLNKIDSNDLVSWLAGIRESTARYIYKRGAWKEIMITLFPSIAWENNTVDNGSDY